MKLQVQLALVGVLILTVGSWAVPLDQTQTVIKTYDVRVAVGPLVNIVEHVEVNEQINTVSIQVPAIGQYEHAKIIHNYEKSQTVQIHSDKKICYLMNPSPFSLNTIEEWSRFQHDTDEVGILEAVESEEVDYVITKSNLDRAELTEDIRTLCPEEFSLHLIELIQDNEVEMTGEPEDKALIFVPQRQGRFKRQTRRQSGTSGILGRLGGSNGRGTIDIHRGRNTRVYAWGDRNLNAGAGVERRINRNWSVNVWGGANIRTRNPSAGFSISGRF